MSVARKSARTQVIPLPPALISDAAGRSYPCSLTTHKAPSLGIAYSRCGSSSASRSLGMSTSSGFSDEAQGADSVRDGGHGAGGTLNLTVAALARQAWVLAMTNSTPDRSRLLSWATRSLQDASDSSAPMVTARSCRPSRPVRGGR